MAEQWIDKKELKKIDDFIKFAISAAEQSFIQSNLISIDDPNSFRAGCIIGSGMGGMPGIEETSISFNQGKELVLFL